MRARSLAHGVATLLLTFAVSARGGDDGRRILDAAGVPGGLVVHIGAGDGRLTAALRAGEGYVVHGLDADPDKVQIARNHIRSLGLTGPVSIDRLSGPRLPYIEDCVNLIVSEDLGAVPPAEVSRVLAPGGIAYVRRGGEWTRTIKPRPAGMDEWTHYLHDPSNNAVAHDSLVDPPGRLQWIAGPRYSRHHDHMSGVSAVVSAGGRVFAILEESPRASILTPPAWALVARDAANGVLLWKRTIETWHEHLWPLKSGPALLPRRLVAIGDRVYVTLGIEAPVSALDAATGRTVRTYEGTEATEEILCAGGTLFLVVADGHPLRSDPRRGYATLQEIRAHVSDPLWALAERTIAAVDAGTGKALWRKSVKIMPLTLAADERRVFFHDGERIVCLDRRDGVPLWSSEPLERRATFGSPFAPTLVVHGEVVLFSGGIATEMYEDKSTTMFAVSARDGRMLWKAKHPPCGHGNPKDILVAGGLVWCGAVAVNADSGVMIGRDPVTGEVKKEFPPDVSTHWFHHRCYRAKATDRYLLFSRTGIEFIDVEKETWIPHHWVRGACLYGSMPANGLIYSPPHPCACYLEAKLFGFTALAPYRDAWRPPRDVPDEGRLERGPAYAAIETADGAAPGAPAAPDDWPTYRRDAARSGSSAAAVPDDLGRIWEARVSGHLSSVVIAEGKLFVASIDAHAVHALDARTGEPAWSFVAGGRIDSPPTIWRGRALFGCADGHVYCLRASDGKFAWRFRAAPEDRRHVAFDQVESVWPVSGSILVQADPTGRVSAYCAAGRSMFVDGGLRILRLDPRTGRKLSETILDDKDPETGENLQTHVAALNMPVALPDILSSDGRRLYMRSVPLDFEGRREYVAYVNVREQKGEDIHLFSPTGFLDDTMWHRTYWIYGRAFASGAGGYYQAGRRVPAGRLLVFDRETVYGYGRLGQFYRWTTPMEFHLFAAGKRAEVVPMGQGADPATRKAGAKKAGTKKTAARKTAAQKQVITRFEHAWSDAVSVQVSAMVLAGGTLFIAGPPDVVDEEQAARSLADPRTKTALAEQRAAFEGERGGLLAAVSAADGRKLAAYRLDGAPTFDGMAAAGGRLYLSTMDGRIICLGAGGGQPLPAAPDLTVTARGGDRPRGAAEK
ncbi:MAG: PQQ-binding-like beta-propeller repeat protein [Planctomycetes bacterium]|nr:PQQ-binding-like beta-propeller repeat protein [Planctomycetota bacterium]